MKFAALSNLLALALSLASAKTIDSEVGSGPVAAAEFEVAAPASCRWHMNVLTNTYPRPDCMGESWEYKEGGQLPLRGKKVKGGHCLRKHDNEGFHSFKYTWLKHVLHGEHRKCHGNCEVMVYSDTECGDVGGSLLLRFDQASSDGNLGDCHAVNATAASLVPQYGIDNVDLGIAGKSFFFGCEKK